jgi:nucleoside-diphosphate-sugar epimerase
MPRILIAGCGFLGEAAAVSFLSQGWEVLGLTHRPESATELRERGIAAEAADLSDLNDLLRLREHSGEFDVLVHCASSGRGGEEAYRAVYLDGMRHLREAFPGAYPIFTSSTSVYAQTSGEQVDELAPTLPDRATGRILLEAEGVCLSGGGAVARLAGIYGPGRSVLLRKFLDGTARIEGDGERVINQIHRDDAARALVVLAGTRPERLLFNVVDDTPAPQKVVYGWLAEALGKELPPGGEPDMNRKRGWTSKRVANSSLRSLGWVPKFSSYRDAIPSLLG